MLKSAMAKVHIARKTILDGSIALAKTWESSEVKDKIWPSVRSTTVAVPQRSYKGDDH
jgi:hypothetical protein